MRLDNVALTPPGWEGHLITPPAALLPGILVGIEILIADPATPVFILEILQWARWFMSISCGFLSRILGHDNLLFC